MKKHLLPIPLLVFLLPGCHSLSKVGGACSYVDLAEIAHVTAVQSSFVLLANEYSRYEVELGLFSSPAKVGERYKITLSKITQGTCTPVNIKTVELIGQ